MSPWGKSTYMRLIRPAIERQEELDFDQFLEKVIASTMQPWVIVDSNSTEVIGAIATQVVEFDSGLRACIVYALATESDRHTSLAGFRQVAQRIETFASDNACDVLRTYGRHRWDRIVRGGEMKFMCFEKKIGG
jgi:hypothetical protein